MLVGSFFIFLTACSKPEIQFSDIKQAEQQLKAQNEFLQPTPLTNDDDLIPSKLPFSESYLEKRHTIFQSLRAMDLTAEQQQLADYLSIAERFPARYFPWPAHANVVANMLKNNKVSQQAIADWVNFTMTQLSLGLQSKLKLNQLEIDALKLQLAKLKLRSDLSTNLSIALTRFEAYLAAYTPRGSIGLYGLANGAPWYQSKLNYFAGSTKAPLQWLAKIQSSLAVSTPQAFDLPLSGEHFHSVLEQWLVSKSVTTDRGLDWAQGYKNLPTTTELVLENMSEAEKTFWLAMMETDLGIHYHAWTSQQAKVNLLKRVKLTPQQADYLVADIVFYPAFSFSFTSLLTQSKSN